MKKRRPFLYRPNFKPTRPLEVEGGIQARSQHGAFSKNWWATRWIDAMERLVDPGRLKRGQSYARQGQVLSMEEIKGGVRAKVQGSRLKPYQVTIEISPLSAKQWEQVIDALAEQALFAAQLLAGAMPDEIETAFQAAGVSLFPSNRGDLKTNCSCPDWANPCKHVAAAHYILGDRFDEDPFLLFRLRGRSQEAILEGLRERRSEGETETVQAAEDIGEPAVPVPPLDELLDRFYELAQPIEGFSVSIRPPAIEMAPLKRLGDPDFLPDASLQELLAPAYNAISRAALSLAFQDTEPQD